MTDVDLSGTNEGEQEMLDAIAAAFGDDAIELLKDDVAEHASELAAENDLESVVSAIDDSHAFTEGHSEDHTESSDTLTEKYILVRLDETLLAIRMCNVAEIQHVPHHTLLPGVPDWLLGVTNLRGNVVSVVDLGRFLGLSPTDASSSQRRLMVAQSLIDDLETGLIVDSVLGIRRYSPKHAVPPTAPVGDELAPFLTGVIEDEDQIIALFDIDKLLGFRNVPSV